MPESLVVSWKSWLKVLPRLNQVTMHRCIKFDSLVNKRMEWHVFSDASVI